MKPEIQIGSVLEKLAGWTGLEPATFCVTGRRSNQLSYHPKKWERRRNVGSTEDESSVVFPRNAHTHSIRKIGGQMRPRRRVKSLRGGTNAAAAKHGAVEVTRTPDRRFRKPLLYPAELPPRAPKPTML